MTGLYRPLRYHRALLALALVLPVALLLAAGMGAYYIPPLEIPRILWEKADQAYAVLVSIRFPPDLSSLCSVGT